MINDLYDRENWNCTHEVSQWFGTGAGLKSAPYGQWNLSFVRWMRRKFDMIDIKEQGCLIIMNGKHNDHGLHVGVWDNGMVHHCCPFAGRTVRSPMPVVKIFYENILFARLKNV